MSTSTVVQPLTTGPRQRGLRKLSPDLANKSSDDTAAQVSRIGLTFIGTVAFCLLSLLSPDSALLSGNEKLNVPFAGPVSFFGFMLLGPAILIVLRVYLQIYVEHGERLDRIAQRMPVMRTPTLVPLKNPLIRAFGSFAFYFLLPFTILVFAWKGAVFPAWGAGLFCVAAAVIAIHLMLPLHRFSWRSKTLVGVCAAILALGVMVGLGSPRRPFNLFRASLNGAYLNGADLSNANLGGADLNGADLSGANLSGANLSQANLKGATLRSANLSAANLSGANLSDANLRGDNLHGANLSVANLAGAQLIIDNLSNAKLIGANLSGANLRGDDLRGANLDRANLSGANLGRANPSDALLCGAACLRRDNLSGYQPIGDDLSGAYLGHASLSGTNLGDTDLSGTDLDQKQLDEACGTDAKLPPHLTLNKPCPTK